MLQRKETKTLKQIEKEQSREAVRISQEVAAEVEEYTKHHVTGQLLTALALVLRKVYGWSDKDTLAALDEVNGITNALNAGEIDDHDLITECEQYGYQGVVGNGGRPALYRRVGRIRTQRGR